MKYQSKCPKCGNVDTLNREEVEREVHCQRCYHHYMYLENIKIGTKASYPFYENITFEGTDEKHVILKDSYGNTKRIYKPLFLKYGKIIED